MPGVVNDWTRAIDGVQRVAVENNYQVDVSKLSASLRSSYNELRSGQAVMSPSEALNEAVRTTKQDIRDEARQEREFSWHQYSESEETQLSIARSRDDTFRVLREVTSYGTHAEDEGYTKTYVVAKGLATWKTRQQRPTK